MKKGKITTSEYVVRHVYPHLTTAEQATLAVIAANDRRGDGRVRMTCFDIAEARRKSERTIRKQTGRLTKDGTWLKRSGWTWVIVGAAEHDVRDCAHPECMVDAASDSRVKAADELAELRKKRDRERKRAARAAKKAGEPIAVAPDDPAPVETTPERLLPRPMYPDPPRRGDVARLPVQGQRWDGARAPAAALADLQHAPY